MLPVIQTTYYTFITKTFDVTLMFCSHAAFKLTILW